MPLDRLIDAHRRAVRAARGADIVLAHTAEAVAELGFNRVAMVQMIWFVSPGKGCFCLDNYGEWRDIFLARNYHRRDPVHRAALRTNRCFAWSELAAILGPSHVHRPILREAARHGLRCGITVPMGIPGESPGSASLATDAAALPPRDHCRAAAWIIDEAFAEVRRLYGLPSAEPGSPPPLSPRRLTCLRLASLGRTDAEIAVEMGVGVSTVHTHMKYLRLAYSVRTRTQLARIAERLGLLGVGDILP